MNISGYDRAEEDANEALEQGLDINAQPETEEPEGAEADESTDDGSESSSQGDLGGDGATDPGMTPPSADDDFNPESWTLRFRGREIQPKDRQHLINLAQQGYLYNQKAQELSARERQLQEQAGQYAQYQQLVEAFQQNPALKQKLVQMYQEAQQGGYSQQAQQPGMGQQPIEQLTPYLQKVNELDQRFKQLDDEKADQEVQNEIASLIANHPDDDWKSRDENGRDLKWEIVNHAYRNNFPTLEAAYRDLMFDTAVTRAKSEALKRQAEQKRKAHKAGIVGRASGKPAGQPKPGPDLRSMSLDDVADYIIQNELK